MSQPQDDEKLLTYRAPQSAWDTIMETLQMDMVSSAFDKDLRTDISEAYDALTQVYESDADRLVDTIANMSRSDEAPAKDRPKPTAALDDLIGRARDIRREDEVPPQYYVLTVEDDGQIEASVFQYRKHAEAEALRVVRRYLKIQQVSEAKQPKTYEDIEDNDALALYSLTVRITLCDVQTDAE